MRSSLTEERHMRPSHPNAICCASALWLSRPSQIVRQPMGQRAPANDDGAHGSWLSSPVSAFFASTRQDEIAKAVDGCAPARRDRGGGVELLHDSGAHQHGARIKPVALV